MRPFVSSSRLRALFEQIADMPEDERHRRLNAGDIDAEDRAALTALLRADVVRETLIDASAADLIERIESEPFCEDAFVGKTIGRYRLGEMLGHGGSSLVFRATRLIGDVELHVALKLLNSRWHSPQSQQRFRREKQILAQLSHVGIAKLLDGGVSEDGFPYICMEYVDGLPLLKFADTHALGRDARLGLLEELCRAVDAAHRSLVVHRDLKPSNVLVTPDGHVKVLDFGTARLLECNDTATITRSIELTPEYAAPEQYRVGPVTTAADVYALGVLAAELLIGARLGPDAEWLDESNVDDDVRAKRRELDADLARMLTVTLARDPAMRYPSAGHLADDIRRFLRKEPLAIHPPSRAYRVRKFARRHRGGVFASTLLFIALAATFAFAIAQARIATQNAAQVRDELSRANAMRDFMFYAFGETEPTVPRRVAATVAEVVEKAVDEARNDHTSSPRVRVEMLTRLGNILGNQGKLERAGQLLTMNVADAIQTLGLNDPLTIEAERSLASNMTLRGEFANARYHIDHVLARSAATSGDLRVRVLSLSAKLATKEHDLIRAQREGRQALELCRQLHDDELLRTVLDEYGNVLLAVGDAQASIPIYKELLNLVRSRFGAVHSAVAEALADLSRAQRRSGDLDGAEKSAREALSIDRAIHATENWRVAGHLNALMVVLKDRRDFSGALEAEVEALRIDRFTLGDSHPDTLIEMNNIAVLHFLLENFATAKTLLRESLDGTIKQYGTDHWQTAFTRGSYGYALAEDGDVKAGEDEMDRAIATFAALPVRDHDAIATVLEKKARVELDLGKPADAMDTIDKLESELRDASNVDPYWNGRAATLRGEMFIALSEPSAAISPLLEGFQSLQSSAKADPLLRVENALLLAKAQRMSCSRVMDADGLAASARALRNPPRRILKLAASLSDLGLSNYTNNCLLR